MGEQAVILKAENIVKCFGGLRAINGATMELRQGEIVGLIGPNGAGKTTMFNMISGVLSMTEGKLFFQGKQVDKISSHKMAKLGIGRTYQIVQPFSTMTVLENTMVGSFLRTRNAANAKQTALKVLESLNLLDKADARGADLSLIDLKRMEVARALATQPTVLLLDEVMAGLNPVGHTAMMEIVNDIRKKGVSIIIIEHDMRAVMSLSDRIYVLNQGTLIAEGLPEEISQNPKVIDAYLGGKKHAQN